MLRLEKAKEIDGKLYHERVKGYKRNLLGGNERRILCN
jgi:hypothetical protein